MSFWNKLKNAFRPKTKPVGTDSVYFKGIDWKNPNLAIVWVKMKLDSHPQRMSMVKQAVSIILKGKKRYIEVQRRTGVPWFFVGILHFKECSCDFSLTIHNGDPWNKKTVRVPEGLGPWKSWEDAAVDALYSKKIYQVPFSGWSYVRMLNEFESFNGMGNRARGISSAYVYAFTNMSKEVGTYPYDHVWDADEPVVRPGAAALLKYMDENNLLEEVA